MIEKEARSEADELVAMWRVVREGARVARNRHGSAHTDAEGSRRPGYGVSDWTKAGLLDLEAQALEAADAEVAAAFAASLALDLAEVAEGDELAIACDPTRAHSELAALVADEQRLRDELDQATRRTLLFIDALRNASAKVSARRRAANLPPHVLPTPALGVAGASGYATPRAWVEALASGKVAPPALNSERIGRLRKEEVELRAELERSRIADEERRAAEAFDAERRRKDAEDGARKASAEHAKMVAKYQAEQKEREELAAANRSATGAASIP
jgi:hypothetical protein